MRRHWVQALVGKRFTLGPSYRLWLWGRVAWRWDARSKPSLAIYFPCRWRLYVRHRPQAHNATLTPARQWRLKVDLRRIPAEEFHAPDPLPRMGHIGG